MMAVTVASIVARVKAITHDDGTRYPELLSWIDDAQREIVNLKPDACYATASVQLVAGTKQELPAEAIQLLDVVRNMGADGDTDGASINQVPRGMLDSYDTNWHTSTAAATIKHYCLSDKNPRGFYVYPPADGTTTVEAVYSVCPAEVTEGGNIGVNPLLSPAIVDYCLYRCHEKDSDIERANVYYQAFMRSIGIRSQNEDAGTPKVGENG